MTLYLPKTSEFLSSETNMCSNPELLSFPFPLEYKPNHICFKYSFCCLGSGVTYPEITD